MADFLTIFNYELKSLVKSAKSTILSLVLVSFFWGIFFSLNIFTGRFSEQPDEFLLVWFLFFAMVASSGFANTSFTRERLSGAFEILFASGISRKTIFFAKLAFVQCASFCWGLFALAFTLMSLAAAGIYIEFQFFLLFALCVFFSAAFLINSINAYLSIININQRITAMIDLGALAVLAAVIHGITAETALGKIIITATIISPAIFLVFLGKKALFSDKAVQNIVF